ncbi:uncharacterized protein LOC141831115 [Curcuma longa]|uniref:uncharacterized protein LOC141831115 n=1 Tax=Curcuma longa TaxID=136217 RepID=UPI003D9EB146
MMLHRRPIAVGCHTMAILCLIFVYPRCGAQPPEDQCPNNFSPSTVTVIIFGLITAFFFLTYFAFYVRQCAGEAAAIAADERDELRLGSAVGLSLDILKSFPTMPYTEAKAFKLGHGDLECAVCLMEFEDDEDLRMLPGCCHVFHRDCIDAWFASHVTCPVCRSDLATAAALESPIPPASSPSPPIPESPPDTVILVVDRDRAPEEDDATELTRIGKERLEARSRRGRRPSKLPRSHTTGHSLAKLDPEAVGVICGENPSCSPGSSTARHPPEQRKSAKEQRKNAMPEKPSPASLPAADCCLVDQSKLPQESRNLKKVEWRWLGLAGCEEEEAGKTKNTKESRMNSGAATNANEIGGKSEHENTRELGFDAASFSIHHISGEKNPSERKGKMEEKLEKEEKFMRGHPPSSCGSVRHPRQRSRATVRLACSSCAGMPIRKRPY